MENIQSETSWKLLLESISEKYEPGQIIPHEEMKNLLLITDPILSDYDDISLFLKARDLVQFEYMSLVQKLKKDLLENYKLCLWNSFGVGYYILEPKKQVKTAYESGLKEIRKVLRDAFFIMTNVRSYEDAEFQRKDSDLVARMSMIKGMMSKIIR